MWQQGLKQGSEPGNPAQTTGMSSVDPRWCKVNSLSIASSITLTVPRRVLSVLLYCKKQGAASELQNMVLHLTWEGLRTLLIPQYRSLP